MPSFGVSFPRRRAVARRLRSWRLAPLLWALGTAPAWALNLAQAVQEAMASDPVFAAARARYQADLEQLPQARASLLPWVSALATGNYADTRTRFTNEMPRRRVHADNYGYQLTLSQPLFDWASWQHYEAAKLGVTIAELHLQQSFQDLLLRVAQTYFDVLVAEETLVASEAERTSIAEQLKSAERNFELGTATITDTYEAQARYDLVEAELLQAQNTLEVRRNELAKLIGRPPDTLAALPTGAAIPAPQPARLDAWVERAETANLTVVQSQLATAISERGIEIARSGHYPQLSLVANFGQSNNRYTPEGTQAANYGSGRAHGTSGSIGVQLNIPIYQGGLVSSRVRQAVAEQDAARQDYETARREAIQATRTAFLNVNSGLAQVRALEAGVGSSRKALEANQTGYEVGVRINLDVLAAQQQLFATQRDLAQARYGTLMSGLQLKGATGQLTEEDLQAINQLLRER
ncbi:MAG: TolC family outer membrane protein [Pigmentiphaga sp.]